MLKVVRRAAAYCEQRYPHGAARLWISTVAMSLVLIFSVLYGVALNRSRDRRDAARS